MQAPYFKHYQIGSKKPGFNYRALNKTQLIMQHEILKNIKPSTLGWGAALLVGLILAYPNIKEHQARTERERAANARLEEKSSVLSREFEFEQSQAEIANKRYESCLPVVGEHIKNGTHYFTGIREGDVPLDRISKQPLPKGTVICDAHGNTGVIDENGKIAFTAYTGNRDLVQRRLSRFRGSQYSQPVTTQGN